MTTPKCLECFFFVILKMPKKMATTYNDASFLFLFFSQNGVRSLKNLHFRLQEADKINYFQYLDYCSPFCLVKTLIHKNINP